MLQQHKAAWKGREIVNSPLLLIYVFSMPMKGVRRSYVDWLILDLQA